MRLKPFVADRVCAKCHGADIHTHYCKGPRPYEACYAMHFEEQDGEHLHRRCKQCGYEWLEACLDEKESSEFGEVE